MQKWIRKATNDLIKDKVPSSNDAVYVLITRSVDKDYAETDSTSRVDDGRKLRECTSLNVDRREVIQGSEICPQNAVQLLNVGAKSGS
jgi:hypothetical protein